MNLLVIKGHTSCKQFVNRPRFSSFLSLLLAPSLYTSSNRLLVIFYHAVSLSSVNNLDTIFLCSLFNIILTSKGKRENRKTTKIHYFRSTCLLFKLGKFKPELKLFCLSSVVKMPLFYFNYTIYSGLLIFFCQNVATHLLYQSQQRKQLLLL